MLSSKLASAGAAVAASFSSTRSSPASAMDAADTRGFLAFDRGRPGFSLLLALAGVGEPASSSSTCFAGVAADSAGFWARLLLLALVFVVVFFCFAAFGIGLSSAVVVFELDAALV